MKRRLLRSVVFSSVAMLLASTAWGQLSSPPDPLGSNPPVFQSIGALDTEFHFLTEGDCRVCHDAGVPDRHHLLYGQDIPDPSLVPNPDSDGDGDDDTTYNCLSCHDQNFSAERDCTVCHHGDSPHHQSQAAFERQCNVCHGDLVENFDDGHYVPSYAASLVTPWTGLHGEGWNDILHTDPYRESDGSGTFLASAILNSLDTGFIFAFNGVLTRTDPIELRFKPPGDDNDFMIDDPGRSGTYTYNVIFTTPAGTTVTATWDGVDTLTVNLKAEPELQSAAEVKAAIDLVVPTSGSRVRATILETDGTGDFLDPEDYAPLGGMPFNDRGFGAGSCSYCHDHDGALDDNGDLAPALIVDNHDTHHHAATLGDVLYDPTYDPPEYLIDPDTGLPKDPPPTEWRRCNMCHDYRDRGGTYSEDSGPNFDLHIRVCEECHGPTSLHNIQADSDGNGLTIGGEAAGYGHVGRDAGPGDSDCWGCHGFGTSSSAIPFAGPIVPTIYSADKAVVSAGRTTPVILEGSGFTNSAGSEQFDSEVVLTAADGSKVNLSPVMLLENMVAVVLPADLEAGNYNLQAVKVETASNPTVVSVVPRVSISEATGDQTVTISGSGFGGYAEGSGTSVTGGGTEATIVSWSDTSIVAEFGSAPSEVTVNSIFGSATAEVAVGGDVWQLQGPNGDATVRFEAAGSYLSVHTTNSDGSSSVTFGVEMSGSVYWMDASGAVYFGNIDRVRGTMSGIVFGGSGGTFFAEQL